MFSYKLALILLAILIGGLCLTYTANFFLFEGDKKAQRLAAHCEYYKYDKKPFPGCEK